MIATAKQFEILLLVFTKETFFQHIQVTSNMLESNGWVNRGTFSDNKKALIDKHLMKQTEVQAGRRIWTYYKTTPLGKVLAMKSWLSGNKQIDSTRPPEKFHPQLVNEDALAQLSKDELKVMQRDLLGSFFQHIPRLEKYDNLLNDQSMWEVHNALKFAFFDIDVNSRFAFVKTRSVEEYGVETKFAPGSKSDSIQFQLTKYFRLGDTAKIESLFDYVIDSLTFIFYRNLKVMKKVLNVKNPVITKILEDPALKSFYDDYQKKAKLGLKESLSFLSDDN